MIAIVCTLLSAAGFYFSFGIGDCWPLAWLAAVPVLWLAFGETRVRIVFAAALIAFALGMAHFLAAYGGIFPLPIMAMIILGPSLLFALSVMAARRIARSLGPVAGVFGFAAIWTACDFVTSAGYNGAVLSPAYSQIDAPFLLQGASLFGIWIVTFLLGFVAAAIAMSLRTRNAAPVVLAAALFAANAGFGLWRMDNAAAAPTTRVGLGADDALLHASFIISAASADKIVTAYADAAHALAAQGATLIVFPEKLAFVKPEWRQDVVTKLAAASRETHATIVIGFDEHATDRMNEALVFTPSSSVPLTYLKRRFVQGLEDGYKTGAGNFVMPNRTGVAICKDMDYPAMLRSDQRAGHPTLLAVPAWDFDADRLAHAAPAIMRGVENGFALARASRNGLLTLTDATGRVIATKQSNAAGMVTLVGDLPRGPGDTVYDHIGDVFGWACIALSLGLLGLAFAQKKKAACPL